MNEKKIGSTDLSEEVRGTPQSPPLRAPAPAGELAAKPTEGASPLSPSYNSLSA